MLTKTLLSFGFLAAAFFASSATAADQTSNFAMVGFDLDLKDEDAFLQSIIEHVDDCEFTELSDANVLCLVENDNSGQLWIGFKQAGEELIYHTANPSLRGESRFELRFTSRVSDKQWEPFEYRIAGEFSSLNIPVLIALADPRLAPEVKKIEAGQKLALDVTGFTFSPHIFESPEAYAKAQEELGEEVIWAPEHFIPSGLFGDDPTAHAAFGGTILKAEKRTSAKGATHWWTLVEIMEGATVYVVFDDISIKKDPKPGDFIVGEYWLSAQLAE